MYANNASAISNQQSTSIRTHEHSLRLVIAELKRHINAHVRQNTKAFRRLRPDAPLPLPIQLLAFQGEAYARLRFTQVFASFQFSQSSMNLIALWQSLAVKEGLLFDLLGKSGLYSALSTECKIPVPTPAMSVSLYFALLGSLYEQDGRRHQHTIRMMTDFFWKYQFCQLYPKHAQAQSREHLANMRQKLQKQLQIQTKLPVEIRESFSTTADSAQFELRWRTTHNNCVGEWQSEPQLTGTKLKPIKRQAYETALAKYGG